MDIKLEIKVFSILLLNLLFNILLLNLIGRNLTVGGYYIRVKLPIKANIVCNLGAY